MVRRVDRLLCFEAAVLLVVTPLQSCAALPSVDGNSPIVDKIPPKKCNGTCDVDTCDFIDNMCLNKLDLHPGSFSLPAKSCSGNTLELIFARGFPFAVLDCVKYVVAHPQDLARLLVENAVCFGRCSCKIVPS